MGRKKTRKIKSSSTTKNPNAKKASTENPNAEKPPTENPNIASTTAVGEAKDIITIPPIPEDIILDILSRLPVKTLLRFRSVCKRWLTILHSPSFVDLQLTHSQTHPSPPKVLVSFYQSIENKYSFYHASLEGGPADCILSLPAPSPFYVSESVYGLVFFYNGSNFYVINPGTRSFTTLPPPTYTRTYTRLNGCPYSTCQSFYHYAFGFDPNCHVYKVLHMRGHQHNCTTMGLVYHIECQVFTMKFGSKQPKKVLEIASHADNSNSWRKITHVPPFPFKILGESVCVKGSIHWICTKASTEQVVLLVFNVASEIFRWMPLPDGVASNPSLEKIGGCLALVNGSGSDIKLWMFEEFDMWVEKTLVAPQKYEIHFPLSSHSGTMYKSEMVYFSSTGCYRFRSYDHRIKKAKPIKVCESRDFENISVSSHVDSLVWLSSCLVSRE